MKLFANIPGFAKLVFCLRYLRPNKKEIEAARASGDTQREQKYILKSTSTWGPMVMEMFGSQIHVQGFDLLPEKGPVVLVGNHQGYADIMTYCAVFTKFQFGFIAKEDLSKIPLYGEWIRRIRSVFIERDDPRASLKAINQGIQYIKQGFSLVIFPEGTRSKGPVPGPFHKGSLKLATKPGVPIVPVSLNGSYKMFEEEGHLKGARIDVKIHPPIETAGITRQEEKELADRVETIIVDGVKELNALQERERGQEI